ncbi:MAG: hypothetical protein FWH03_04335 [Firmicutes bacterium]|nr:hypothetical protein [Bacillota bacterium]
MKTSKRKMWAKLAVCAVVLLLCAASASLFIGCGGLSEEEEKVVGKYEAVSVSVLEVPEFGLHMYDYFTMDFKSNKKVELAWKLKSSYGGASDLDTADWRVRNGKVEVITRAGFSSATEYFTLDGDVLSGTNAEVVNGQTLTYTFVLHRVAAAE